MRGKGKISIKKIASVFVLFAMCGIVTAQEPISFEKHDWKKNTMAGHHWKLEIPIELGHVITLDEFEDTDAKEPSYLGVAFKLGLKNSYDRGIAFGLGLDYTTNRYFRLNLLLDLDFLYNFGLADSGIGNKTAFSASFFTKFCLTKLLATVDGAPVNEYYLRFNVIQMRLGRFGFGFGKYVELFRKKYVPTFAETGGYFSIFYHIR